MGTRVINPWHSRATEVVNWYFPCIIYHLITPGTHMKNIGKQISWNRGELLYNHNKINRRKLGWMFYGMYGHCQENVCVVTATHMSHCAYSISHEICTLLCCAIWHSQYHDRWGPGRRECEWMTEIIKLHRMYNLVFFYNEEWFSLVRDVYFLARKFPSLMASILSSWWQRCCSKLCNISSDFSFMIWSLSF